MQTSMYQLFIGVLMWTIVMIMPPLIAHYKNANPVIATALLTTLYPISISFLSRRGSFWLSPNVIMLASVAALIVSLGIRYTLNINNDSANTWVPISIFILAVAGLSTQIDMYNSNVYKSA